MFRRKNVAHTEEKTEIGQSEQKIKELREALGPLSGRQLQYCNDPCLRRYLEARNGNLDKAKKMVEETLKWRSSFRPEDIRWCDVEKEGETGKLFRANFHDRHGRTVLILRPGMQNTKSMEGQIKHLVYNLENATFNLADGQEQMAWLIDFTGWSVTNSVPIKTTRDTINILQNHYPERLGIAFLYNPPRIFESFWRIVKYFFDAKTIQKVKFVYPKDKESVEVMRTYFDIENLPTEFGGNTTLSYDHAEFSKLMAHDDAKYMGYWGINAHPVTGHAGAAISPEPGKLLSEIETQMLEGLKSKHLSHPMKSWRYPSDAECVK